MDTKIEIKQEDPFSDNVSSPDDREFFNNNIGMKTNSNTVLLDGNYDMGIKIEIKSEASCLQDEGNFLTQHFIKQFVVVTCNKKIEEQTIVPDFGSQNEREFLQEDPARKIKKYNSDEEIDDNIEVKEECWWKETHNSTVCDEIKGEHFPPVGSPRSFKEGVSGNSSGKSPLSFTEDLQEDVSLYVGKDSPVQKHSRNCGSQGGGYLTLGEDIYSQQSGKRAHCGKIHSGASYLKQQNGVHDGKRSYKCEICERKFTCLSHLKRHSATHEGKKPYKCEICQKRFTRFENLERHNLLHEGKKLHKCEICEKEFTRFENLKRHNLFHKGEKLHKCEICEKRFTQLSDLKRHNLIHAGNKPHKCEICHKRFSQLSYLKSHNLVHEGKKPHQCEVCEKKFIHMSDLKRHNLHHEGKKPYKCGICGKSFTRSSNLKRHNLIHEGKKPHQCKLCDKKFTLLSSLKRHSIAHEGKKT